MAMSERARKRQGRKQSPDAIDWSAVSGKTKIVCPSCERASCAIATARHGRFEVTPPPMQEGDTLVFICQVVSCGHNHGVRGIEATARIENAIWRGQRQVRLFGAQPVGKLQPALRSKSSR
jgi:hypothetical protein